MTPNDDTGATREDDDLGHPMDAILIAAYRAAMGERGSSKFGSRTASNRVPSRAPAGDLNREDLCGQYENIIRSAHREDGLDFRFSRRLGEGGQGIVRLTECGGADGFTNSHLAVKFFSPHLYPTAQAYVRDMTRIADVARIVAGIDHGNLVDVQRFENLDGVRVMLMKQVQGYDLSRLMHPTSLHRLQENNVDLWHEITKVIAKEGTGQVKFRPGAAMAIVRSCLMTLDRVHNRGLVYGDVKPSNIMLTPEGDVKIVDVGSAYLWETSNRAFFCTPEYAAPETLKSGICTPQSDLASLGYVLLELLLGKPVFNHSAKRRRSERSIPQEATTGIAPDVDPRLIREKETLVERLPELLPHYSTRLHRFIGRLIDPDVEKRFESAVHADVDDSCGAYKYMQELELCRLACHFQHEYRQWLQSLTSTNW